MMRFRNRWVPLLLLSGLLGGCAATHYQQGRKFLRSGENEAAIRSFKLALQEDISHTQAVRDLGVAYFREGNMDYARRLLVRALERDSTDARTLLYLGMVYEKTGNGSGAIGVYRRYVHVSTLSAFRNKIRNRLTVLIRQQMAVQARRVLAQEARLDLAAVPEHSVAVLAFRNLGAKRGLDPLQKGLAEMVITDLSQVRGLRLIERLRIQTMMEEMGLGATGMVDEQTAPRLGMLLGSAHIVSGGFIDLSDRNFRIDAGLVNVKESAPVRTVTVTGGIKELFRIQKDLVFRVIKEMGITLSREERDAIEVIPTQNLLAFMAFCRGLDYEDRGMFREAEQAYMEALSRDPSFRQAEQHLEETRVLSSGIEDVAELDRLVPRDIQRRPEGTVLDHTLHLADVLNQGFLPGVDRRKPIEEQNQSFFGSAADFEFRVLIPQR